MNNDFNETENDLLEEELEAAADYSAEVGPTAEELNEQIPYAVSLSKEYELDGVKIKEVDLSGLADLTTVDAQAIDRVMDKMKYHPQNKFRDTMYTKHIAMRVSGLPVEFFNSLHWKDMEAITARITLYFLF